jgi:hypothetical protein
MKTIGFSVLMVVLLSSCFSGKNKVEKTLDTTAVDSSVCPQDGENKICLNFKRINKNIEVVQTGSAKIKIPASMIDLIKESFNSCEDCYGLGNFSDTVVVLDLNKEQSVSGFVLVDINFDGKTDIRFPSEGSCCMGNNVNFETWLNKTNTFVYHEELSEMPVWEIKKDNKTISGGWQMGALDYVSSIYTIENDSLKLIQEESSETVQDTMVKKVNRKLVDNKWVCDSSLSNIN